MNPAPLLAFLGLLPRHAIGLGFCLVVLVAAVAAIRLRNRPPAGARRPAKPRRPGAPGPVEIYVGNLSYDMNDDQLRALFAKYGVVDSARIITHRPSGKSKGYGFVEMPHRAEAELAVGKINNTEVMGRRIRCNEAREDSRPDR